MKNAYTFKEMKKNEKIAKRWVLGFIYFGMALLLFTILLPKIIN